MLIVISPRRAWCFVVVVSLFFNTEAVKRDELMHALDLVLYSGVTLLPPAVLTTVLLIMYVVHVCMYYMYLYMYVHVNS